MSRPNADIPARADRLKQVREYLASAVQLLHDAEPSDGAIDFALGDVEKAHAVLDGIAEDIAIAEDEQP